MRTRRASAHEEASLAFDRVVSTSPCRYLGGLRLLQATCKKFYQFCSKQGWETSACFICLFYTL